MCVSMYVYIKNVIDKGHAQHVKGNRWKKKLF